MAFNPIETLHAAGVAPSPENEEYFSNLSEQETNLIISLKGRLPGFLPEVQGHSADWSKPEALQVGQSAEMACACGAWSGSGSGAN